MTAARAQPGRRWLSPACTIAWLGLAACGKILGVDEYSAASPASCGSFAWRAGTECASCVSKNCCVEATACADEKECSSFAACLSGCPLTASTCRANCYSDHEKTRAAGLLASCLASHCAETCSGCGGPWAVYSAECDDCISQKGCGTSSCLNDPECSAFRGCTLECPGPGWLSDPGCRAQCAKDHPDADLNGNLTATFNALGSCSAECGLGQHWECSATPSWPIAEPSKRTRVTLGVRDLLLNVYPAVEVTYCDSFGQPCSEKRTTGSDGLVDLDIDQTTAPGHFELLGPPEHPWRMLAYPERPIVGDRMRIFVAPFPLPSDSACLASMDGGVDAGPDARRFAAARDLFGPSTGAVVVFMADCVGSMELDNGASVEINPNPGIIGPLYALSPWSTGCTVSGGQSGQYVWFGQIPPTEPGGKRLEITGYNAAHVQIAHATNITVLANTVTTVYLNFPAFE